MNKYKVEFTFIQKYIIDVKAKTEAEAEVKAQKKLDEVSLKGIAHYYEIGDPETEVSNIYDVTNTEDPFNP